VAFGSNNSGYELPEEYKYDYMMHQIAKNYGMSIVKAASHTELDFWMMAVFERFDNLRSIGKNEEEIIC